MQRTIVGVFLSTLLLASLPTSCLVTSAADDDDGGAGGSGGTGGAATAQGGGGGTVVGTGGAGGEGGGVPEPPPAPECVDEDLLFSLGDAVAMGDTTTGTDDATPSCGFEGGNDVALRWFAEEDGLYIFDTLGSDHDTAIEVLTGCPADDPAPESLACNDNHNGTPQSSIPVSLDAGDSVVVVVDAADLTGGNWVLNVNAATCPANDLGTEIGSPVAMGNSGSNPNVFNSTCGQGSWPDATYRWEAPATGTYAIDLDGTSFAYVLDVLDGVGCDMPSLGCNTFGPLLVDVTQGQELTIVVDAVGTPPSDYVVNISEVSCPDQDLGSALGTSVWTGNTTGADSVLTTSSCGGSGPEQTFAWTAPASATFTFDTVGSDYDTVIDILDGGCGGASLGCNDQGAGDQSTIDVSLTQGQQVTILVDSFFADGGGNGVLNITQN